MMSKGKTKSKKIIRKFLNLVDNRTLSVHITNKRNNVYKKWFQKHHPSKNSQKGQSIGRKFLKKNRKIILVTGGDGGFGNLGDEWLLDAVKERYKKFTGKFRIIILKANPPTFSLDGFSYMVDDVEEFKTENISIEDIKAVHFYGGGYLNSFWMKDKLWLYDLLTNMGFPKQNIFFTNQGLGPFNKGEFSKVKKIAAETGTFGVRDSCFANVIKADFMFDESVFLIDRRKQITRGKELWINFRIAKHVGIDENKLGIILESLVAFARSKELQLKFFSMINGKNFSEKKEMERILAQHNINEPVIEKPKNYRSLLKKFKGAGLVVTTSYHATLASLYSGVPVISVYENDYYSHKFKGLSEVVLSPLLKPVIVSEGYDEYFLSESLAARDEDIYRKINQLKRVNNLGYKKLMRLLDAP